MREKQAWHTLKPDEILKQLASDPDQGLSRDEIAERLKHYGPNRLPARQAPGIFAILLHQILNPLILILLVAAIASLLIGEMADAIFILVVVVLNSGLGGFQEFKAEKSAAALQSMLKVQARVVRGGKESKVDAEELVPGDIVLLESGVRVPADLALVEAQSLRSDESFLTGESVAVGKKPEAVEKSASIGDRPSICFGGSTITSGRGRGIVVATGSESEVGEIARAVSESEGGKPPLLIRMERFTRQISFAILGVALLLALLMQLQGETALTIFFFVVALAVAAIPEGLPVALTVALSIATSRMSQRGVVVRKLTAVESLGSCTVIASDKTGTLTVNEQTLRGIFLANGGELYSTGAGYNGEGELIGCHPSDEASGDPQRCRITDDLRREGEELILHGLLASEGGLRRNEDGEWVGDGDAMDVGFHAIAYKSGSSPEEYLSDYQLHYLIPYESEARFSAAAHLRDQGQGQGEVELISAKGAVETILDLCGTKIDAAKREELIAKSGKLAADGYRVLGVAALGRNASDTPSAATARKKPINPPDRLPELNFLGLAAFIDPLRTDSAEAVATCRSAGIRVMMITGDHPETARNIGRQLAMFDESDNSSGVDPVASGRDVAEASERGTLAELVANTTIFARVSAGQKRDIVDSLIEGGEFVAVTGDGVNDAPAMRSANIGVAMGSGTDVAKEVGTMIVSDDRFASIVSAVEEGRYAYSNVRKVTWLLIATGAGLVTLFIGSTVLGLPMPLIAVQLLWLNLVTNGIQDVALAFEKGERYLMKLKPRRPGESLFDRQMIEQTLLAGAVIGVISLGYWWWLIDYVGMAESSARNLVLLLVVLMQNIHALNCRSEIRSIFQVPLKNNYLLMGGIVAAQGLHLISMQLPFMQNLLRVEPIAPTSWGQMLLLTLPLLAVMEIWKWWQRRRDPTLNNEG